MVKQPFTKPAAVVMPGRGRKLHYDTQLCTSILIILDTTPVGTWNALDFLQYIYCTFALGWLHDQPSSTPLL